MKRLNVAIADDKESYLTQLSDLIQSDNDLQLIGKARDGEELYQIIVEKEPDIVLLDIIMPKLDGLGVMERVFYQSAQERAGTNPPVFIIVTSIMQETITQDAFSHGASYYIVKPFQKETILNRIKYYYKNHEGIPDTSALAATDSPSNMPDTLERDVSNTLYQIGIPNNLRGFAYLRDSVMLSVQNIEMLGSVTKILYYEVAKRHNATNLRVERAIRHAIDLASKDGLLENIEKMTGYPLHTKRDKPSNTELIAFLTDIFRLKYKNTNQLYN